MMMAETETNDDRVMKGISDGEMREIREVKCVISHVLLLAQNH